ncbi:MAG: pilus assembly PilX family protein [Thermodesulfobacteriota bacterium]
MKKKIVMHANNEDGSVIIIALLVLCIVTVIGVSSIDTTIVEQQVASNDQLHKMVFYETDGGVYAATKLISRVVTTSAPVTTGINGVTYMAGSADPASTAVSDVFYLEIMSYTDLLGRQAYDTEPDVEFLVGNDPIQADIRRIKTVSMIGGGVEFASGAEGVGAGSAGGAAIYYNESVQGTGTRNSAASLTAEYRKVIGIPNAGEL